MIENHIVIHKMKCRLNADSYKSAIKLKENVSDFLKNVVIKIIEEYIAQYESDRGIHHPMTVINQVKLNVAVPSLNLDSSFSIATMKNELRNQLDGYFNDYGALDSKNEYSFTKQGNDPESSKENNKVHFSEYEIRQKAFLFFLQHGSLPWYCSAAVAKELLLNETIEWLFTENTNDFIKRFIALGNSVLVRKRIVYQLDTDLVLRIFYFLERQNKVNFDSISLNTSFFGLLTQTEKKEILLKLFESWYKPTTEQMIHSVLEYVTLPLVSGETKQNMLQKIELLLHDSGQSVLEEAREPTTTDDFGSEVNSNSERTLMNSGLILLHPFLKIFFDRLGILTADSKLKNPELCVHLLHYLATGNESAFEHQMGFEKLLCGIPHQVPIERFVVVTEEMKEEAQGVLNAVLANWTILRSSGIELLQNEFLVREGKVTEDEKSIDISFERKTQDILVDRIEWTLSYVKLPWLDKIIRVNW